MYGKGGLLYYASSILGKAFFAGSDVPMWHRRFWRGRETFGAGGKSGHCARAECFCARAEFFLNDMYRGA